jgi:predicted nucleic acid-binding protein
VTVFADSSALVTRYASEAEQVELGSPGVTIVSVLARVEVPSAIWRKQRMGELSAEDAAILVAAFEADYHGFDSRSDGFVAVAVRPAIVERAARLVAVHALRGYDAVQLASALSVTEVVPECSGFAALDRRLRAAAAAEGLALLPPAGVC